MPDPDTRVLAFVTAPGRYSDVEDDDKTAVIARREQHTNGWLLPSYWWVSSNQEWPDFRVSHWMPLPAPPVACTNSAGHDFNAEIVTGSSDRPIEEVRRVLVCGHCGIPSGRQEATHAD